MIELTENRRQELSEPEPFAFDPKTGETYVLVRKEASERMKTLLAMDEYDPDEEAGHINEVMAEFAHFCCLVPPCVAEKRAIKRGKRDAAQENSLSSRAALPFSDSSSSGAS